MSEMKRNKWLEDDLEEEDEGQNSEEAEESRGQSFRPRSAKRPRLGSDSEADGDSDVPEDALEPQNATKEDTANAARSAKDKAKVERKLAKTKDAASRSGVIYMSHIPPFMKPHTLKNLLAPYAPSGVGRVFLTPEDHEKRQARIRGGGNKKRNFVDGWVEFVSKKEAKVVVETLNTRNIGGKKGGYYFDDVWNLKYLKGFKWRHLTEQIANENAERAARMRAEGSSSRREMREFLKNVERSKIEETRQKKKANKARKMGVDPATMDEPPNAASASTVKQNIPIKKDGTRTRDSDLETVKRVLSKVF
jgi:ESF2/ABP1 family protein